MGIPLMNGKTLDDGEQVLYINGDMHYKGFDLYEDSQGSDYKEMLKNKLDYCINNIETKKANTSMFVNGGWGGKNYGFGFFSKIGTIYQLAWFSSWGTYYCRKSGSDYTYSRSNQITYTTNHNPASSGNYLAILETSSGEQTLHTSPGFGVYNANGTNGRSEISLGNATAQGTDGARDGVLRLFSKGTGSNYIVNQKTDNNTYWNELPAKGGTFAMLDDIFKPTTYSHSANACKIRFSNGFTIVAGTGTAKSSGNTTINYGVTFSEAPTVITQTRTTTGGVTEIKLYSKGTSSMQVVLGGSAISSVSCDWIAFGHTAS
jgi:hypothetical protein